MAEGFFWGNDPNVNSQLRQRIAMAMLARQKKYPKTFGEGLAAIGESLGDIGMQRKLEQQDLAQQAAARNYGATGPQAEAPTETKTAYAPPADVAPAEPAAPVEPAAPNLLAQLPTATETAPQDMTTIPTAAQPASTLFDAKPMLSTSIQTPPAGRFTPREAIARTLAAQRQPLPEDGGYNLLDAQAGMPRLGPGRVQDTVERIYPNNPDMQGYASQLAAAEQPKPGDTSKTGAAGPWQFVPGTARQYGLTDPNNIEASGDALKAFTADNAAAFRKINGREPTMADLAVMHQQGGVTGAKMVAGTGNAPARNLEVNNVPPGASSAAAVAKIKGYYGMPETPVGPRDVAAAALMPKPPVMAFDGSPSPAGAAPPLPLQQTPPAIRQAPSAAPPIAQAPPDASPYRTQKPLPPTPMPISRQEQELTLAAQSNPYLVPRLQAMQAARTAADARNVEDYKSQLQHFNAVELKGMEYRANMPKTQADIAHVKAQTEKARIDAQAARAQDISGKVIMGDDGVYRRPKIEGANPDAMPSAKLTKEQSDSVKFLTQMHLMGEQLKGKEKILAEGLKDEVAGRTPFVGNALMSRQYRMAKTAAETWVQANLRDISGAVIGTTEHAKQMQLLMPRYGDTDEDLARKAQARSAIERGMYSGLGTDDARGVADYNKRQNLKELQDKRNEINAVMHKKFPDAKKGDTKTNSKGRTRVFDGNNWLEAD